MEPAEAALLEEACRKTGLVWITLPALGAPRPAWHVWADGAVHVVHEGREQSLPGLQWAETVQVTVRSKDKGSRLLTWTARPVPVEPGTPQWAAVVPVLAASRLNARDAQEQPARWASESRVTRLEPTGDVLERPGRMATTSGAAPPLPTPATTIGLRPHRQFR
jgi:hypothetical protein